VLLHDVKVSRVEAEGSRWQAIRDQVDPEKLDWDQSFGDSESGSQEDAEGIE